MDKLLSIIIPSYNMEKYLSKCLGSLIVDDAALLQLLDVIVVNDGSKDRTSEIAHEFAAKYPGMVRFIDKPNGNYGSCINAALPMALGTFVKVLDADDTFDTAEFSRFLNILNGVSVDLVLTDFVWVDEADCVFKCTKQTLPENRRLNFSEVETLALQYMHAVTYRTEILREMGYWQDEGISYTDNEWACMPMARVESIYYCPCSVYRYLYGRIGQTMDPKVAVRSLPMKVRVANRLVGEYNSMLCKRDFAPCDYVCRFIEMFVSQLYNAIILGHFSKEVNDLLVALDTSIKGNSPELFDYLYTIGLKDRHFSFNYGSWWRSQSVVRHVLLMTYRTMLKVRRKCFAY